jgi:hypothetical protein
MSQFRRTNAYYTLCTSALGVIMSLSVLYHTPIMDQAAINGIKTTYASAIAGIGIQRESKTILPEYRMSDSSGE